jgi:hypothetical protein
MRFNIAWVPKSFQVNAARGRRAIPANYVQITPFVHRTNVIFRYTNYT